MSPISGHDSEYCDTSSHNSAVGRVPDVQRFRAEYQLVVPLVYLPNVSGVIRHTEIGERREFSATCPFIQQFGKCVLTL